MKTIEEMLDLGFEVSEYNNIGLKYKDGYRITRYVGESKDIVIPEGVVAIGCWVFYKEGINSVVFPESLDDIREGAFAHNNLTEIDFKNVKFIEDKAFIDNPIEEFTTHKGEVYKVDKKYLTKLDRLGII